MISGGICGEPDGPPGATGAALGAALVWFLLPTDAANVAFGVSSNGLQVRGSF